MISSGNTTHNMIVKVCSRKTIGGATPLYNEKMSLEVSIELFF